MSRRWSWGVAVTCAAIACSYRDVPGDRHVVRSFTVRTVATSPLELVLAPADCATELVVVAPPSSSGTARRHPTDVACLSKLQVGATITLERQREKQGCMPGKVYYAVLGGCALGSLELVTRGAGCRPGSGAP